MRRSFRLIPLLGTLVFCLLLTTLSMAVAPALAASTAPVSRPQTPASEASMDLYMRLSAINFCLARSIGQLEVAKAVPIAGETVVVLLQNEHGSRIEPVGDQPLSIEELRRGAYDSVLLGALTFCPQDIPEELRQSLETTISSQIARASGSQAPGTPADSLGPLPLPPSASAVAAT